MKIVRQLADWLLQNDRITPERYGHVMDAILGGADTTAGFLIEAAVDRRDRREAAEDAVEEWWNLRGAGVRARSKAARRKGGGGTPANTTPVKVWDLDPRLPGLLFPPGGAPDAFPLATLLLAVDEARGNRRAAGWDGFAAAAAALYKAGGDELHDALRGAMEKRGRALGPLLAAMESGATLFPDGFLGGLSGESVTALRKRVDGGETAFSFVAKDWILRYPSFNALNEACLVRNRLRRVYRLWVRELAEWDERGTANRGVPSLFLAFGKTRVAVPLGVRLRMFRKPAPAQGFPAFNVLAVEKAGAPVPRRIDPMLGDCLNFTLDGRPALAYRTGDAFVAAGERTWPVETIPDNDFWILHPVGIPGSTAPRIAPPAELDLLWFSPRKLVDCAPNNLEHLALWPWETLLTDDFPSTWYSDYMIDHFGEGWHGYVIWQLSEHPEVVDRIKDKLDGTDWSCLLRRQPQFADYCDWSKLDSDDWRVLLRDQPQFADRCDWSKLNGSLREYLVRLHPQLAAYAQAPAP